MTTESIMFLVLGIIALFGTGYIAFAEAALLSADRRLLKQKMQDGNAAARKTLAVVTKPEILHGTLLLLINICMVTYTIAGHRVLSPWSHGLAESYPGTTGFWLGVFVNLLILDGILLLLGEILPKTWALTNVAKYSLAIGPSIHRIGTLLKPVAETMYIIPGLLLGSRAQAHGAPLIMTEAQLRIALALGSYSGAIEDNERELGLKVIDVAETSVDRVMTLRRDIFSLPAESTVTEALTALREVSYSRMPIIRDGDLDEVVGILNVKDLMGAYLRGETDRRLSNYARPVLFIPEKKRVFDLMLDFKSQRSPLALVVDEAGSLVGLVTLEDCLEEVVGEIYDEHDAPEDFIQQLGANTFMVDGRMEIDEVRDALNVELDDSEYKTIGGLVMGLVGRVPVTGMRVHHAGLTITVTRMVGRRLDKLRIYRQPSTLPGGPGTEPNPRMGAPGKIFPESGQPPTK